MTHKTIKAAHPNSRFTVRCDECPSYSDMSNSPNGVPISAIIYGGRRPSLIPLVYEAKSWSHGVLVGAAMSSQTTAAATGQVGILRNDPMAMKPFCGYHFGDYWSHWLSFAEKSQNLPKIFHVNWFRTDDNGKFLWPGFGENIRVLDWIIQRCSGKGEATSTPIGYIPSDGSINTKGLNISDKEMQDLCNIAPAGWKEEIDRVESFLNNYDPKTPKKLYKELETIKEKPKLIRNY